MERLENLKYMSAVAMYNIFKASKPYFLHKVNSLIIETRIKEKSAIPTYFNVNTDNAKSIHYSGYLIDFLRKLELNKYKLVIGKYAFNAKDLRVNFIDKEITLGNKVIVKDNKLVDSSITVMNVDNKVVKVIFDNKYLLNPNSSAQLLLDFYRNSNILFYSQDSIYNYFNKIKFRDLIMKGYVYNESYNNSTLFALYFYEFLYTNSCKSLDKNKEFTTIGENLALVFDNYLLPGVENTMNAF